MGAGAFTWEGAKPGALAGTTVGVIASPGIRSSAESPRDARKNSLARAASVLTSGPPAVSASPTMRSNPGDEPDVALGLLRLVFMVVTNFHVRKDAQRVLRQHSG